MIRCEQLILGWSEANLLRSDGFGPIAASEGWPLDPTDRSGGLGEWSRFLPEGSSSRIAEGEPAPFCAAHVPVTAGQGLRGGTVLLSKVYLSGGARPGQYFVHALWDPTGRVRPAELAAAYREGLLLSADTPPPTGALPAVEVPVAEVTPVAEPNAEEITLAGHLVHAWLSGYPLIVNIGAREPIDLLDQWSRLLPDELARVMAMATFLGRGDTSPASLAFAVFPFSPAAVTVDELLGDHHHDDLGREVVGGAEHVADPVRLRAWARMREVDLGAFRRGPGAATDRAAAQAAVVEPLGDRAVIDSLFPALLAQPGRPVIAVPRLAELAANSTLDLGLIDWAVGTPEWSRLSNHLVRVWLTGSRRPAGHLLRQVTRAPDRFAAAVTDVLAEPGAPDRAHLVGQLTRWPDEHLEALLAALVGVELPVGVLLDAIVERPEQVVRRVLRTHWPQLADQAALGVLGRVLRVPGGRLFDRR